MPTDMFRMTISIPDDTLEDIDTFYKEQRMKSRTQAIISLIRVGMEQIEKEKTPAAESATGENGDPKSIVGQLTRVLSRAGIVRGGDISDRDYEFLLALFMAVKAHFDRGEEDRE